MEGLGFELSGVGGKVNCKGVHNDQSKAYELSGQASNFDLLPKHDSPLQLNCFRKRDNFAKEPQREPALVYIHYLS